MKALLDLTKDFKTSRAIFKLTVDEDGRDISLNFKTSKYKYTPTPEEGNILSKLVCDAYSEQFSIRGNEFIINKNDIAESAMRTIRNSMCTFLEKNLQMRNPRQSKVYRFYYRNQPNTESYNNAMIMVYKYIRSFTDDELQVVESFNQPHINNTIALLEAIMEKYEN